MFHAESGMKKGPPVNMAKKLVKLVNNTKVISGRSSIQGILKRLGEAQTAPGGSIQKTSSAFICSSELSSSIVEDKVATTILTDLYDRNYNVGEWQSLLKMESFSLTSPTITMLTATNEAHSSDFFLQKDISGGYFARTFIIYEHEENRANDLLVQLREPIDDSNEVIYLKKLATLKGEIQALASRVPTDYTKIERKDQYSEDTIYYSDAGLIYADWYRSFKELIKQAKDPTGTLNRFGDSVLKVAILLSLSKSPELIIDASSMEEAFEICEKLLGNIRRVTMGKNSEGTNTVRKTRLLQELMQRENHMITRTALLKKYWMQGNANEWDECVVTFEQAGVIQYNKIGNQIVIEMLADEVEKYEKLFKGKIK
jgi:hypothetical protein